MTALEIQKEYLEACPALRAARRRGPDDARHPGSLDGHARPSSRPIRSSCDREVDWVIKRQVIEDYMSGTTCRGATRGSRSSTSSTTTSGPSRASTTCSPRNDQVDRWSATSRSSRPSTRRRRRRAPACAASSSAGRTSRARTTGRLGPPQAERPGARDDPLQGPVPGARRAGRAPDPVLLARSRDSGAPPRSLPCLGLSAVRRIDRGCRVEQGDRQHPGGADLRLRVPWTGERARLVG